MVLGGPEVGWVVLLDRRAYLGSAKKRLRRLFSRKNQSESNSEETERKYNENSVVL